MKYCEHCGAEVDEQAVICVKCGFAIKPEANKNSNNGLLLGAKVLMIVSCVLTPSIGIFIGIFAMLGFTAAIGAAGAGVVIGIIYMIMLCTPLAWCLPMTIVLSRKMKNNETIGVGFKICTLLFVSTIAGILLLCAGDNN